MINMQKHPHSRLQAACVAAVLGFTLAACQTAQMPEPTRVEQAVAWDESVAANYAVDEAWWQQYHDAQLNQLLDTALANNLDLQKAALTAEQALYSARAAGTDLMPSVSGSLSGSASKNIKDGGHSSRSYGGQVGLSYEVDLWQRLRDSADAKAWAYRARSRARLTICEPFTPTAGSIS